VLVGRLGSRTQSQSTSREVVVFLLHGGGSGTAAGAALPVRPGQHLLVGGGPGIPPRGAEQPAGVPVGALRRAAVGQLLHHPARPKPEDVRKHLTYLPALLYI
jgi:hypothetical protein